MKGMAGNRERSVIGEWRGKENRKYVLNWKDTILDYSRIISVANIEFSANIESSHYHEI